MLGLIIGCVAISFIFSSFYVILEYSRLIPMKTIGHQIFCVSIVQVIWIVAYMVSLYLYDNFISRVLYIIAGCFTVLVIYKGTGKLGYWILTNLMLSPMMSFVWMQIDNSPFDGFMGGPGQAVVPLVIIIINMRFQLSIWLCIKLYKWLFQVKERLNDSV